MVNSLTGLPMVPQSAISTILKADQAALEDGDQKFNAGDYKGALESFLKISPARRNTQDIIFNIGFCYRQLGDHQKAENAFRLSYKLSRNVVTNETILEPDWKGKKANPSKIATNSPLDPCSVLEPDWKSKKTNNAKGGLNPDWDTRKITTANNGPIDINSIMEPDWYGKKRLDAKTVLDPNWNSNKRTMASKGTVKGGTKSDSIIEPNWRAKKPKNSGEGINPDWNTKKRSTAARGPAGSEPDWDRKRPDKSTAKVDELPIDTYRPNPANIPAPALTHEGTARKGSESTADPKKFLELTRQARADHERLKKMKVELDRLAGNTKVKPAPDPEPGPKAKEAALGTGILGIFRMPKSNIVAKALAAPIPSAKVPAAAPRPAAEAPSPKPQPAKVAEGPAKPAAQAPTAPAHKPAPAAQAPVATAPVRAAAPAAKLSPKDQVKKIIDEYLTDPTPARLSETITKLKPFNKHIPGISSSNTEEIESNIRHLGNAYALLLANEGSKSPSAQKALVIVRHSIKESLANIKAEYSSETPSRQLEHSIKLAEAIVAAEKLGTPEKVLAEYNKILSGGYFLANFRFVSHDDAVKAFSPRQNELKQIVDTATANADRQDKAVKSYDTAIGRARYLAKELSSPEYGSRVNNEARKIKGYIGKNESTRPNGTEAFEKRTAGLRRVLERGEAYYMKDAARVASQRQDAWPPITPQDLFGAKPFRTEADILKAINNFARSAGAPLAKRLGATGAGTLHVIVDFDQAGRPTVKSIKADNAAKLPEGNEGIVKEYIRQFLKLDPTVTYQPKRLVIPLVLKMKEGNR